jgi:uncharacterized membrane protein
MKFFETILKEYSDPTVVKIIRLGADETQKAAESQVRRPTRVIDRKAMRQDLRSVKKDNNRYFFVCVSMVILLFIVCIVLVIMNACNSTVVTVVMSGFGISAAGLIKLMTGLWRSKSNTELLLVLALNTDGETLTNIVNILASGIQKK